jgi:Tfp pilus assembly protein PilE
MRLRQFKNIHGVTLMEILFVVIIIGVVTAFGIPYYEGTVKAARQKTAKLCLELIKEAQENYHDDNNTYYYTGTNVAAINTNLHLAIIGDVLAFSCAAFGSNNYKCLVRYPATGTTQWCCGATKSTSPSCPTSGACP